MRCMLTLCTLMLLISCTTVSQQSVDKEGATSSVKSSPAEPQGKLYLIDPLESDLRIVTYPKGRFGHAHVIGGEVLHGQINLPENHHHVQFNIELKVTDFKVDNSEWRQDEGLDPDMSERAIQGTRDNMLSDKVLNAKRYPVIRIQGLNASGPLWQPDINAEITLAGISRKITLPVSVMRMENSLVVTGQLQLLQTDFGIEPFTALGGIIGVADKILIRFRIHAKAP